jgi:CRP-like cAMP-binding protein
LQAPPIASVSGNHLLAAFPAEALQRLAPHFQPVPLVFRETVFEAGDHTDFIYFPLKGMVSLIAPAENGRLIEVGIVGKEGMTGVPVVLGDDISNLRGVVQAPGSALKLNASALKAAFSRDRDLRSVLLRYTRFALAQAAQSAICIGLHSLEQRCARWLLTTRDRVEADSFPMTHEFLAYMLGVRRAGVTVAAKALQQAGLIRYARNQVTILDPGGLAARACECNRVLENQLARLPSEKTRTTQSN